LSSFSSHCSGVFAGDSWDHRRCCSPDLAEKFLRFWARWCFLPYKYERPAGISSWMSSPALMGSGEMPNQRDLVRHGQITLWFYSMLCMLVIFVKTGMIFIEKPHARCYNVFI
jgi:hypothetical protein